MRAAVAEQVQSLGAAFLELEAGKGAEGEGGYARELTDEEKQAQQTELADKISTFDVVITTALVPGRRAPILVTARSVEQMKPGSVIVDLAGESGGNCELTEPGEVVVKHDVTIVSPLNLPATMPEHASALYARNVQSLLELLVDDDGELNLNFDDEIIEGACITRDGEIVHEGAKKAVGTRATRAAAPSELAPRRGEDEASRVAAPKPRRPTDDGPADRDRDPACWPRFVGFQVISKVPNTLHTPLMSGTNAIHGIVVLGGLIAIAHADGVLSRALILVAIIFGTINVVGGFLVTDRMLSMFKRKPEPAARARTRTPGHERRDGLPAGPGLHRRDVHRRVLAVHHRPVAADEPDDGGAGQQDRGRRHGDRGRRDAAEPRPRRRRLPADRRRSGDRHGDRRARRRAT